MAEIRQSGYDDFDEDSDDREEPLRVALPHESRHTGTITEVSEIHEREDSFDGGTYEELIVFVESEIDELDIPDDKKEVLRAAAADHFGEERDTIRFPLFAKANISRGAGPEYSDSKLYETLYKLDLVEPEGDHGFKFLSADGNETEPFDHIEPGDNESINEALSAYLDQNAVGLDVEWEVKNSNIGSDDEYSVVGKIVSRED